MPKIKLIRSNGEIVYESEDYKPGMFSVATVPALYHAARTFLKNRIGRYEREIWSKDVDLWAFTEEADAIAFRMWADTIHVGMISMEQMGRRRSALIEFGDKRSVPENVSITRALRIHIDDRARAADDEARWLKRKIDSRHHL